MAGETHSHQPARWIPPNREGAGEAVQGSILCRCELFRLRIGSLIFGGGSSCEFGIALQMQGSDYGKCETIRLQLLCLSCDVLGVTGATPRGIERKNLRARRIDLNSSFRFISWLDGQSDRSHDHDYGDQKAGRYSPMFRNQRQSTLPVTLLIFPTGNCDRWSLENGPWFYERRNHSGAGSAHQVKSCDLIAHQLLEKLRSGSIVCRVPQLTTSATKADTHVVTIDLGGGEDFLTRFVFRHD